MFRRLPLLVLLFTAAFLGAAPASSGWKVAVDPNNSFQFLIFDPQGAFLGRLGTIGWGPDWAWTEISAQTAPTAAGLDVSSPVALDKGKVALNLKVRVSEDRRSLVFRYQTQTPAAVPILGFGVALTSKAKDPLPVVLNRTSGGSLELSLPRGPGDFGPVSGFGLKAPEPIQAALSAGWSATSDGELRLFFARDRVEAGLREATLTLTFPSSVRLMGGTADLEELAPVVPGPDWFAYRPTQTGPASAVSLAGWLDTPAGVHGGVRQVGDQFLFEDGTPAKFWGTNLSYGASAPEKDEAVATAERFVRQGVNAVRMHKFTNSDWEGIGDSQTAVKMDPKGLDRLDYFAQQLASRGIYYGWSHSFGLKVRPGDRARLAGYDELMKAGGSTYAVINWAEDVQDLMIEMVVNLLKHKNPYTGKTYAQDPALSFLELQNEDDIFFYTSIDAYQKYPTYRNLLEKRFSAWLNAKYKSQDALASAWGGGLKAGEGIAAGRVSVEVNPWFLSSDHLPQQSGAARTRLLDNAAFLHEVQNSFYRKFVAAVRAAGYQGPIAGSSWQAPSQLPHYLNLKSDALVGFIDRHNYFGGQLNDTLLSTPGGGYLSSGLDQVAGRPFALSEWITTYPSLYTAEGPFLVAAYGLGLQGWDASYIFQSSSSQPGDSVGNLPWGIWNADAPSVLGPFPLLARMVLRGDVTEAPPASVRRITESDLASGKFSFEDRLVQSGDVKAYGGSTAPALLAQGKALVELAEGRPTAPAVNPSGSVVRSSTGQLTWDAGRRFVTIDTAGTQGYVGFAAGQTLTLGDLTIKPQTDYASVLVTAADRDGTLAKGKTLLISAVARNANQGFRVLTADGTTVVANGDGIRMEPVRALISFSRTPSLVEVLDASGRPTGALAPLTGGTLTIDTGRDRTLYYRVRF